MLAIDDFLFYFLFDGSATDFGLNSFSTTISGATLTTNKNGVSNKAYLFDGVNDQITLGTDAYDEIFDAINAGVVGVFIKMYNDKASNNNDLIFTSSANPLSTNFANIGESEGTNNWTYYALGNGSLANEIHILATPITGAWKTALYQTTFNTTNYLGRININGTDLSLTKSNSNQLATKSVDTDRQISIGWRADSPANRSFKGSISNVFAITRELSSLEMKFINKFEEMKRVA